MGPTAPPSTTPSCCDIFPVINSIPFSDTPPPWVGDPGRQSFDTSCRPRTKEACFEIGLASVMSIHLMEMPAQSIIRANSSWIMRVTFTFPYGLRSNSSDPLWITANLYAYGSNNRGIYIYTYLLYYYFYVYLIFVPTTHHTSTKSKYIHTNTVQQGRQGSTPARFRRAGGDINRTWMRATCILSHNQNIPGRLLITNLNQIFLFNILFLFWQMANTF